MGHSLAVCSWSLRTHSGRELAACVRSVGLRGVQLALDPIREGDWDRDETIRALEGIELVSGMMAPAGEDYSTLGSIARTGGVRPDGTWEANLAAARGNAAIAAEYGIGLVTLHAGFIPDDPADPEYETITERVARLAGAFGDAGVRVALETGQETAVNLLAFLDQPVMADVAVNFDPANMLLYGSGEPIEALQTLLPRVVQCHMKDANVSGDPGRWGTEVVAGKGDVPWDRFFATIPDGIDVVIEREAGERRIEDVGAAIRLATAHGVKA